MRYFFIYYTFNSKGFSGDGNMTFNTKSGFPSISAIAEKCKEEIIKNRPLATELSIVIANIQEFKKKDFETFIL